MAQVRESRFGTGLEIREEKQDGSIGTITGYAAVFNQPSQDLGGFVETIRAGAFGKSLSRGDDIRALVGHDTALIIGRRSAKTLEIGEDEKGLWVRIHMPDTTLGRDTLTSVKRRDLTGQSFAFETVEDQWTKETKESVSLWKRELIEANLFEISIVSFPAYEQTSADARSVGKTLLEEAAKRFGEVKLGDRDRRIAVAKRRMDLWTGM